MAREGMRGKLIMSEMGIRYINGTVLLSAANTFTEVEIDTNLSILGNVLMDIWDITFEMPTLDTPADGDLVRVQITEQSKMAMANLADVDVIGFRQIEFKLITSGLIVYERVTKEQFNPPYTIGKDSLFFGAITSGETNPRTFRCRIGYTARKVSDVTMIKAFKK